MQSSIISQILAFIFSTVTIFSFDHMTDENRELLVYFEVLFTKILNFSLPEVFMMRTSMSFVKFNWPAFKLYNSWTDPLLKGATVAKDFFTKHFIFVTSRFLVRSRHCHPQFPRSSFGAPGTHYDPTFCDQEKRMAYIF